MPEGGGEVEAGRGGGGEVGGNGERGGGGEGERVPPCAVLYDEIDAHVGGRAAVAVGNLLARQGKESQVVVVTHTAQVAALADEHLVVDKVVAHGRPSSPSPVVAPQPSGYHRDDPGPSSAAVSPSQGNGRLRRHAGGGEDTGGDVSVTIREVKGSEREAEVARMAAGDIGGPAAAELAREMLRHRPRHEEERQRK
ncbi:unnamed protein product [Discosporangium mesarthrocarpum]